MRKSETGNVWRRSNASSLDDDSLGFLVVLAMSDWKREQIERDRRHLVRKTMDAAENRMRERTAKEQHAAALAELQRDQSDVIPDDEDDSSLRNNILR